MGCASLLGVHFCGAMLPYGTLLSISQWREAGDLGVFGGGAAPQHIV